MFAFVLCLLLTANVPAAPLPSLTRVIVMSLDGARPDAILQANTPYIQSLAARGASTWAAQTVYPSVTNIGHASMLTGLSVEDHGVDHNDSFLMPCPSMEAPTFLTIAQQAGYSTAMVVGKERFCYFHQMPETDYTFATSGDFSVVDRVLELIDADYQVILAHFPNPDYFGHLNGWMSDIYISQMSRTDAQIGRILDRLDERGITDETLVILTADHGGHDFRHGTDSVEDMTIPWIVAGPNVIAGTTLENVSVMDTAATVLYALGLPVPENFTGRPVTAAFGETFSASD